MTAPLFTEFEVAELVRLAGFKSIKRKEITARMIEFCGREITLAQVKTKLGNLRAATRTTRASRRGKGIGAKGHAWPERMKVEMEIRYTKMMQSPAVIAAEVSEKYGISINGGQVDWWLKRAGINRGHDDFDRKAIASLERDRRQWGVGDRVRPDGGVRHD